MLTEGDTVTGEEVPKLLLQLKEHPGQPVALSVAMACPMQISGLSETAETGVGVLTVTTTLPTSEQVLEPV